MERDHHVSDYVRGRSVIFHGHDHDRIMIGFYDRYHYNWGTWRSRYVVWAPYGFYGGYYWDVHPFYTIDTYFYCPEVYWFYNTDWDVDFYHDWYGDHYTDWAKYQVPFNRPGVFFPTEEFRDINIDVAGLKNINEEIGYRQAMNNFSDTLALEVSKQTGVAPANALLQDSIVIDHYQLLLDDWNIEIEGFVSETVINAQGASVDVNFPFKALIDLGHPALNIVFIPTGDSADPNSLDAQNLKRLNDKILSDGGVVDGQPTDGTQPAPVPAPVVTQPEQPVPAPVVTQPTQPGSIPGPTDDGAGSPDQTG
jgi:hypothetical protein